MRRSPGFTLIELVITVTVMGILAALAIWIPRAAFRNASLNRATYDFVLRLSQLRNQALSDQLDYLVVGVNTAQPQNCTWTNASACTRYFILTLPQNSGCPTPTSAWRLNDFIPNDPAVNASVVNSYYMPKGVQFHLGVTSTPPAVFNIPTFFDGDLTGSCSGQKCFAVCFAATGEVRGVVKAPTASVKNGYAFALTTDAITDDTGAADRKGILVTFPTGMVKAFPTF